MREVHAQRRHRDAVVVDGVEIGAGTGVGGSTGRPDPVRALAARRGELDHGLGLVTLAQTGHLDAAQVLGRDVGNIDVEQQRLAERRAREPLDQLERHADGGFKVLADLAGERHRDRGDAEQVAFDRGGDGAGIDGVVAHVGPEVDPRDDDVGSEVEQARDRDVHAIGGCAVNGVVAVRRTAYDQRTVERERVGSPRAAALGRDHRYLAQTSQRLREQWVVRLSIEPGERTRVHSVDIRFTGAAADDPEAHALLKRVRENWPLRPGLPFRQEDWDAAKRLAVRGLAGWRYAAAQVADSQASIDPQAQRAALSLELASGPPFRFGELHVTGTKRYDDELVENLASMRPGDTYDREKVVLYQRRLLESGYFASVQAEIDVQPELADAAPLRVSVIEAPKHHFEYGIGYNTDVGPRLEARYTNQDVLDTAWRFGSQLNLDKKIQNLQLDLNTPPPPYRVWYNILRRARGQNMQNQITRELAVGVSQNYGATAPPSALIVSAQLQDQHLDGRPTDNRHAVYRGARQSLP